MLIFRLTFFLLKIEKNLKNGWKYYRIGIKKFNVSANYGVDLYKLDETLNKWNKLGLQNPYNPNNENAVNSIVPTPCN